MLAVKEGPLRESRYEQAQSPRHTPSKAPSSSRRHISVWDRVSLFGTIVLCTTALWVLAATSGHIAQLGNNIVETQSQIQRVEAENASLTAKLDALTRPSRVLGIAINQLHMKYANPVRITVPSH